MSWLAELESSYVTVVIVDPIGVVTAASRVAEDVTSQPLSKVGEIAAAPELGRYSRVATYITRAIVRGSKRAGSPVRGAYLELEVTSGA